MTIRATRTPVSSGNRQERAGRSVDNRTLLHLINTGERPNLQGGALS
jgi:hypothetical protein